MDQYPKWLYHRTNDPVIVNDPDEHLALGRGWEESPVDGEAPELEVEDPGKPKGKKNANR